MEEEGEVRERKERRSKEIDRCDEEGGKGRKRYGRCSVWVPLSLLLNVQ